MIGDIVYFYRRSGNRHYVDFGLVNDIDHGITCIDLLKPKETRRINGIPLDEFPPATEWRKLPKGWTWSTKLYEITFDDLGVGSIRIDDPSEIKRLYDAGIMVKAETIFNGDIESEITTKGYRIVKKYPMWATHEPTRLSIRSDKVYASYKEAEAEVGAVIKEIARQTVLSDEEWSIEQIDNTLNHYAAVYQIPADTIQRYRDWLLALDNIEDVVVRLYMGGIQWKYDRNKKWSSIEV